MSIPELMYLAMGALTARVLLVGTGVEHRSGMDWLRLIFDILRIVILWPLVLVVDKVKEWSKTDRKE
jgi:hypothetical protein